MNALWQKVNREMVAKILAELEYERILRAEPVSTDYWRISMGSFAPRVGSGAGCILTLIP